MNNLSIEILYNIFEFTALIDDFKSLELTCSYFKNILNNWQYYENIADYYNGYYHYDFLLRRENKILTKFLIINNIVDHTAFFEYCCFNNNYNLAKWLYKNYEKQVKKHLICDVYYGTEENYCKLKNSSKEHLILYNYPKANFKLCKLLFNIEDELIKDLSNYNNTDLATIIKFCSNNLITFRWLIKKLVEYHDIDKIFSLVCAVCDLTFVKNIYLTYDRCIKNDNTALYNACANNLLDVAQYIIEINGIKYDSNFDLNIGILTYGFNTESIKWLKSKYKFYHSL